jgi:hypothetical protein
LCEAPLFRLLTCPSRKADKPKAQTAAVNLAAIVLIALDRAS